MAETQRPQPVATPDSVLARRLAQGRPGAMEDIRARYALTIYAMAYGKLLDARQAAAAVEDVLTECRRIVTQRKTNGEMLSSLVCSTAHAMLSSRHVFATPQADPAPTPASIRPARMPGILRSRHLQFRRADDRTAGESYASNAG